MKYRPILPELDAVAEQTGFMSELQAAADKIRTRQEEFEERQAKREAAQAAAPAQPGIARNERYQMAAGGKTSRQRF